MRLKHISIIDGKNDLCRKALLSELKVMKDFPAHKHVIQLFGCITESGTCDKAILKVGAEGQLRMSLFCSFLMSSMNKVKLYFL